MRKKIVTVLLTLVMAASAILGGCGEAEETGGRAERREETRESEEKKDSEESRETQNESDNTENPLSDILGLLGGDEPERLVRPEDLALEVWFEYEYDEAGNLTGEGKYGADGSVLYVYYEYEYDKPGNMTKRVCYYADGSVYNCCEYKCDASGNRTKEIGYGSDGNILSWYEYEYDEAGNLTKTVNYNSDGSVDYWIVYEYDKPENKPKEVKYNSNGSIVYSMEYFYEYEYDESGNLTKKVERVEGNDSCWVYEYDKSGNLIKMVKYDSAGSAIDAPSWKDEECEYDKSGNLTKTVNYNADGSIHSWNENEYDKSGNKTKEVEFNSDGSVQTWNEYEYDKSGNIIKYCEYHLTSNDRYTVNIEVPDIEENNINQNEETYFYNDPDSFINEIDRITYRQLRERIIRYYVADPNRYPYKDLGLNEALISEGCQPTSKIEAIEKMVAERDGDEEISKAFWHGDYLPWKAVVEFDAETRGYEYIWAVCWASEHDATLENWVLAEGEEFEAMILEGHKNYLTKAIHEIEVLINVNEKYLDYMTDGSRDKALSDLERWREDIRKYQEELDSLGE